MAEISEKFEPETMRRSKPGLKRVYVTVSVLVSFVLGFPLLYKSVEIYRAPLPFHDVDSLSNDVAPPAPYHFHALFLNSHLHTQHLRASLLSQITKLTSPNPNPNFTLSVSTSPEGCTQPSGCGSICAVDLEGGDDDDVVDEKLEGVLGGEGCGGFGGKAYSVVVAVDGGGGRGVRAVVGKYRHGWVVVGSEVGAGEMVEVAAEMFVKVFANGGREEEGGIKGEFMPVGSDGRIVLSFSLLNAEPRDWVFDWDFQMIDEMLLAPVIEALAPIANISVESQVLYHTPKSSFSPWDKNLGSYIFSTKDLPFFVNSNEWHLDTSIAAGGRSKILQFVVYIPSAKECPLLLQLPNKEISSTNGFISPMWGGVMVWNPQGCLKVSENKLPDMHMISSQDLQKVFEVFMGQFRQLFGLKSERIYVGSSGTYNLLPSERGFTEWELDFLSREHTYFNLHSSATTLGSLSRLVQSLPRMIIMDEIGKQVKYSVEAAKLAQSNAALGVYNASAVLSRQARSLAEDAFFHPSIMSVSYYSFEHCFAVYSPFFLPVSMHVLLAALREWKRYKQEKAKYLLWKATAKVTS